MNILKKALFSFILFATFFSQSFALVLEGDIKLNNTTNNSLDLSWEPVDGALGYFVYYDTVSHSEDKLYSYSIDDIVDGTGVTLENLSPNTEYYIALRVVDGEGNEGDFSKEFLYSTVNKNINNTLFIESINVINKNKIIINFNIDINSNKDKEFKIEDKNDNTIYITINNISINGNQVELDLGYDLEPNKTYTLTVISLTGINGETINAGVDGVIDFNTGNEVEVNSVEGLYSEELLNNNINEDIVNNVQPINIELNSAGTEINSGTTTLSGANLTNEDINKTAELAAKKVEKLPQTGPAEWLLLIFALGLAFVIIRFKKA